jgi:hypothetical protein
LLEPPQLGDAHSRKLLLPAKVCSLTPNLRRISAMCVPGSPSCNV